MSKRWSKKSDACRIEMRPSRLCAGCVAVVAGLGAIGWWASDATTPVALAGSVAWLVAGALLARRELVRPARVLILRPGGEAELDGCVLEQFDVDWRGPIFSFAWREEGSPVRWLALPDVLDAPTRRELRLWRPETRERGKTAAVAP